MIVFFLYHPKEVPISGLFCCHCTICWGSSQILSCNFQYWVQPQIAELILFCLCLTLSYTEAHLALFKMESDFTEEGFSASYWLLERSQPHLRFWDFIFSLFSRSLMVLFNKATSSTDPYGTSLLILHHHETWSLRPTFCFLPVNKLQSTQHFFFQSHDNFFLW